MASCIRQERTARPGGASSGGSALRFRFLAGAALVLAVLVQPSCLFDSCDDCPDDAHRELVTVGGLAPYPDTVCISGSSADYTIVNECCCD